MAPCTTPGAGSRYPPPSPQIPVPRSHQGTSFSPRPPRRASIAGTTGPLRRRRLLRPPHPCGPGGLPMPRRFLNRDDDLQLDLRQGASSPERLTWMQRAQRQQRLPKPLTQLEARGVWVPPPPARSQGAVVKLWLAKASTTGVHTAYLRQGKGLEGADAELFDRNGPVDRLAFVQR